MGITNIHKAKFWDARLGIDGAKNKVYQKQSDWEGTE